MSQRYLGGVITANPTTPTMTTESGVWTLEQQFQYSNVWSPEIVGNSLRFRSSASAYLQRTFSTPTNQTTFTISCWVKRGKLGATQTIIGDAGAGFDGLVFSSSDQLLWYVNNATSITTTAVYRDPAAWYHVVLKAAGASSVLYVNGQQVGSASSAAVYFNTAVAHLIGQNSSTNFFDGYMAEMYFVDGQALTPSSFGAFDSNGVWQPLAYTGTYGTNGFYLDFSDNSGATATTIGKDYSGNGNNWTPNNISVTSGTTYDSMIDTPTPYADGGNGRGNYAVLNPLFKGVNPSATMQSGNLELNAPNNTYWYNGVGTTFVSSGKWYAEFTPVSGTTTTVMIGVANSSYTANDFPGGTGSNGYTYVSNTGNKFFNNTGAGSAYGASFTTGDVIGVALDLDSGSLTFYKNGTSQGVAFTGIAAGSWTFAVASANASVIASNFGQRPFAYTPPTGYKALNTQNLPVANITNGAQYMAATTFDGVTGGGTVVNTVNSVGFQPDFVWMKARNSANNHELADSVRGTPYALFSNLTNAEVSDTRVSAFNSNGFSYGTNSNSAVTGRTSVGWQWKAGGTAVSNTNGSITSSVSANTTAGFSVVTYTGNGTAGATIGHGLGVAPSMMIAKNRSSGGSASYEWTVYHASLGATKAVFLNDTGAAATDAGYWYNTAPTSTLITVPSNTRTNVNGSNFVIYCFAEVAGFSKFGSYTGNGSADGVFVYLGFRPRWVMVKLSSSAGGNWIIVDTARDSYNVSIADLFPNSSSAEASAGNFSIDVISNGFKLRTADAQSNSSGSTYIFAAFAENPFQISRAR